MDMLFLKAVQIFDARVVDFGCTDYFGIAEVKCPYTEHHVTPLDACTDTKFFMEKAGDIECKLKVNNPYYATSSKVDLLNHQ